MKELFFLDQNIIYLNHGSYGACPKPVFDDYQSWQKKIEYQPVQFLSKDIYKYLEHSREALGNYVKCDKNDLIFYANPSSAINTIISNLKLTINDEVLMSTHEYGALIRAWKKSAKIKGFKVIEQHIKLPLSTEKDFVKEFWSGVNKRTKVIFLSQITSATALIFPVKQICELASKAGIITIIDGAHVPGHINLNIKNMDCDFYSGACHKWLCGPKGSSFLYVKKKFQKNFMPLVISWGKYGDDPGPTKFLQNFQWQGTTDISSFLTVPSAINFQVKNNWISIQKECRGLIRKTKDELSDLFNDEGLSVGGDWLGQMVSFPLPKGKFKNLKFILLNDYRIEVPIFNWRDREYIRVSVQAYNKWDDITQLIKALKTISK
tara:strand:+ start:1370 stop:2503 length:1134 start_codon:yes stop_codon:yes gene_type:complete